MTSIATSFTPLSSISASLGAACLASSLDEFESNIFSKVDYLQMVSCCWNFEEMGNEASGCQPRWGRFFGLLDPLQQPLILQDWTVELLNIPIQVSFINHIVEFRQSEGVYFILRSKVLFSITLHHMEGFFLNFLNFNKFNWVWSVFVTHIYLVSSK